jgi:hypothetical protein
MMPNRKRVDCDLDLTITLPAPEDIRRVSEAEDGCEA